MRHWLSRNEWTIVGIAAVLAFVLGVLGMRWQMALHGIQVSWADAAYFSLRLFTVSYDFAGEGVAPYAVGNLPLEVARFLAPVTLPHAVVKGLILAAASHFNLKRVSRWKGHAVVCGGGAHRVFWWLGMATCFRNCLAYASTPVPPPR